MIGVNIHKLFQDIMHCLCLLLDDAQALNPMNSCEELSPLVWFQRGQQFSVARPHVYFWYNMSTRSTSLFAMIAGSFSRAYRFVFQQGLLPALKSWIVCIYHSHCCLVNRCFLLSMHKPCPLKMQNRFVVGGQKAICFLKCITLSKTIFAFCCPYRSLW